nr:unnamed protein product [Spirometra erinaceieuropaei]
MSQSETTYMATDTKAAALVPSYLACPPQNNPLPIWPLPIARLYRHLERLRQDRNLAAVLIVAGELQVQISDYRVHSVNLCSNLKQEAIVNVAKRYGYNVLALAQNLDDMAVSFLSSVFHNGTIQTLEANVEIKDIDLRLIRPLVFCREKMVMDFVKNVSVFFGI